MKKFNLYAGLILIFIGLVMFLRNVSINGFGFYRIGRFNTGGVILVLLLVSFVAMIAKYNKVTLGLFITCFAILIISLILGIDIRVRHMNALDFILIGGTLFGGVGLAIKGFIDANK